MKRMIRRHRRTARGVITAALSFGVAGCQFIVNPFEDELADRQRATTPSVDAARAAGATASATQPRGEPKAYPDFDDRVSHLPLYFEDPFEDKGSEDDRFAWTGEDYLWMFYARGRFLLNALAFPVSAVVTPPWTPMASDGRLSRQALGWDHDAERWDEALEPDEANGS